MEGNKMKKILSSLLVLSLLFAVAGCSSKKEDKSVQKTIEVKEMREIAELATVDCYFHNVAKSDREVNPEWYQFWEKKNMRFWVEYEGIVTIGIDVSKLKVEVSEDNVVTITLPEAVVLDAVVNENSLTSDSFYFDPNAKKPSPEEQTEAFKQAQSNMKESAEKNHTLLANAQANAKELLKNYVNSIGEAVGVEYTIEWKYLEGENVVPETESTAESSTK
jgi:hypothetical protein